MSTTQDPEEQVAPAVLEPLPGALNLLDGTSGGLCSGGTCRIPGFSTSDADHRE